MSEDKPSGESLPPQQSFGDAPAAPSGQQSLGDAPAAPPPPPLPPPPAAPRPPAQVSFGEAPSAPQPAGQASFGEAPSAPHSAESFGEAPPAPPVAHPVKKRGWLKIIGGVVVALILLSLIGVFLLVRFLNSDPTRNVGVGDCLADVGTVSEGESRTIDSVRQVDCTDPAATHKVEGRYEDKTAEEATTVCAAHPTADFMITRAVAGGDRSYVLCVSLLEK